MKLKGYTDLLEVGHGAQGTVYRAQQPRIGRTVALKVTRFATSAQCADLIRRLRRIAGLSIQGIPRVYDIIAEGKTAWAASEFVEGVPLSAVPTPQLSPWSKLELGIRLAQTLHRVHASGVVHGDLKPRNAILTRTGDVVLVDLGFARERGQSQNPESSAVEGTVAYLAPELLSPQTPHDRAAADLYALGVVLYELLLDVQVRPGAAGQGITPTAMGLLPAETAHVVTACLASSPEDRPRSAELVAHQLVTVQGSHTPPEVDELAETGEYLFGCHMARCCVDAARGKSRRSPNEAYRLLAEALEWDPDNGEAVSLLQTFHRSSETGWRRWTLAATVGIALLGAALAVSLIRSEQHSSAEHVFEVALADTRLDTPRTRGASAQLPKHGKPALRTAPELRERKTGRLRIRGLPGSCRIMLDGAGIGRRVLNDGVQVDAGVHTVTVRTADGSEYSRQITVLPFERKSISLPVSPGKVDKENGR